MELNFPKLPQFQIPQGGGSRFDPSVGANAQMEAARMIVNPVQRAFEQMVNARMREREMNASMEFETQQSGRRREDALMLQRMQDSAALQRVEAQINAQREEEAMRRAREESAALAARDLMTPMSPGLPGFDEAPGPLSVESLLRMPAAQPGPAFAPITDAQARSLGAQGVAGVASQRGIAQERAQNNREQAVKADVARQEADAQRSAALSWKQTLHGDKRLSAEDKLAVLADFDVKPEAALQRYEALVAKSAEAAAKRAQDDAEGRVELDILGDRRKVTRNLRVLPGERKLTSQMPDDAKAELWDAAEQAIRKYATNDLNVQAAMYDPVQRSSMIRAKAYEAARALGWVADDENAPLPGNAATPQGAPPPQQDAEVYNRLLKEKGREPTREEFRAALGQQPGGAGPSKAPEAQAGEQPRLQTSAELRAAAGSYVSRAEGRGIEEAERREMGERERGAEAERTRTADLAFLKSAVGDIPKTAAGRKDALDRLDDLIEDASGGYRDRLKRARSLLYDLTAGGS